jgi:hypothetical protein
MLCHKGKQTAYSLYGKRQKKHFNPN